MKSSELKLDSYEIPSLQTSQRQPCLALFTHTRVCNLQALQHVNARLRELYPDEQDLFDIVLMTNNHAQVGVRLINSVNHYGK